GGRRPRSTARISGMTPALHGRARARTTHEATGGGRYMARSRYVPAALEAPMTEQEKEAQYQRLRIRFGSRRGKASLRRLLRALAALPKDRLECGTLLKGEGDDLRVCAIGAMYHDAGYEVPEEIVQSGRRK